MLRFLRCFRPVRSAPQPEVGDSPLWLSLCRAMEEEALWQNPELCLDYLSRRLQTNRTTLARLYRAHGTTFACDVRERRISFILDQLEKDSSLLLEPLFYEAGYRNYSTAWRQFRRVTGVTPSVYQDNLRCK